MIFEPRTMNYEILKRKRRDATEKEGANTICHKMGHVSQRDKREMMKKVGGRVIQ